MIKKILKFFRYLLETTELGFYEISSILAKGFFFYFYLLSSLFEKIFKFKFFEKGKKYFQYKQGDPIAFLVLVLFFFIGVFLHTYLYVDKNDVKYVDGLVLDTVQTRELEAEETTEEDNSLQPDNSDTNLYRKYGKYDINAIRFSDLKEVNQKVVAWIMVDGTSVNYPIVQGEDNEHYLYYDILERRKNSGWTFMDYRNHTDLSDMNTVFYGHNLLNKTAFGGLANVFTEKWFKSSNHYIVVRTETERHVYEIFSCYYIEPEVYYLQTDFYNNREYQEFLDTITKRSFYNFDVEVGVEDKIITLSTCTDDNKGRKAIHAKMIG